MRTTTLAGLAAFALGGCAPTHFYGSAKVEKGPRGCSDQCQAWGMELVGMVKMGEYSDGCICQVRPPPPAGLGAPTPGAGAPLKLDGPAVAGVWMQMQAAAAQAAQADAVRQSQRNAWSPSGVPPYGGATWR